MASMKGRRTKRVYNYAKEHMDTLYYTACPRCKGNGGLLMDEHGTCYLCKGYGMLWYNKQSRLALAKHDTEPTFY